MLLTTSTAAVSFCCFQVTREMHKPWSCRYLYLKYTESQNSLERMSTNQMSIIWVNFSHRHFTFVHSKLLTAHLRLQLTCCNTNTQQSLTQAVHILNINSVDKHQIHNYFSIQRYTNKLIKNLTEHIFVRPKLAFKILFLFVIYTHNWTWMDGWMMHFHIQPVFLPMKKK